MADTHAEHQMACHDCDLLHRLGRVPEGATAWCTRCGAVLWRRRRGGLDPPLAMVLTAIVLFVLANAFPFLGLQRDGIGQETTLVTGVVALYEQGMWALATVVLLTTELVPLASLLGLTYVILPLRLGCVPWHLPRVFRFVRRLEPWSMMEVFLLGILVSMVKLAKMAEVVAGPSLYAFGALIFVLAAVAATLDPHEIWHRWGDRT